MAYILDTNIIRKLLFHFPKKGKYFETVWEEIESEISNKKVYSVDECFNELHGQFAKDNASLKWLSERKGMFLNPNNEESLIIRNLFRNPKMRESIHEKNIINNRPSADVYIAAKAKLTGDILVTEEEYKPNSAQLPNICAELGVKYISFDSFMEIITSKLN